MLKIQIARVGAYADTKLLIIHSCQNGKIRDISIVRLPYSIAEIQLIDLIWEDGQKPQARVAFRAPHWL